jgi:hypothetical protein
MLKLVIFRDEKIKIFEKKKKKMGENNVERLLLNTFRKLTVRPGS